VLDGAYHQGTYVSVRALLPLLLLLLQVLLLENFLLLPPGKLLLRLLRLLSGYASTLKCGCHERILLVLFAAAAIAVSCDYLLLF